MSGQDHGSLIINDPYYKLYSGMPKPEFMLIGAAKSGSTSFSSYLPLHPQVRECVPKEPNYWAWKRCNRQQYQNLFVNSVPVLSPGPKQIIGGEYSTDSLLHPLVPRRVRGRLPDLKIIILLRNPVARAYSHFIMSQRDGRETAHSFDDVIKKEMEEIPVLLDSHMRGFLDPYYGTREHCSMPSGSPISVFNHDEKWTPRLLKTDTDLLWFYYTSCIFRSLYHDQVWRWLQLYPRDQVMIIQAEDFFINRTEIMNKVVRFLNLQPFKFDSIDLKKAWGGGASNDFEKPGDYMPMKDETRKLLENYFAPFNDQLFSLIGEQYNWQ
jgi:hypothetical protein